MRQLHLSPADIAHGNPVVALGSMLSTSGRFRFLAKIQKFADERVAIRRV
jgi:hypothetical protein